MATAASLPTEQFESTLGPYAVTGFLGSGGTARVHAAIDRRTGERVALKRLVLPTPASNARFLREIAAQGRIAHPNVLPWLEILPSPDGPVLVLPLVSGPSLAALLEDARASLAAKLAVFREIVEGVAAIHATGWVHRDLKPHNVLLEATGDDLRVWVADFGLALALEDDLPSLTRTGARLGTPAYMAPEQRRDASRVDARADVWSLGVLLAELLTGARGVVPDGDGPWEALARRMSSVDPDGRPSDGNAVLAALPPTDPPDDAFRELCRARVPKETQAEMATLPEIPRHLPDERDAFVGRFEELGALAEALAASRWVSLVGAGGIGKTRTALRYALLWLEEHPGGAWLCDLSEARDVDGITRAVARSLDVPLGTDDPVVRLGHALAGRGRCLVVLDNFEQVATHAAATLGRWLAQAPSARFLVTTREPLGLPEEQVLDLPPLSSRDAFDLFVRRAEAIRQVASEGEAIRALVERLDGLPLAIELCAARVRVMAPSTILERITERFRVLAAPGSTHARHATLRAALDWSWDLLSPDEQRALAQLSVFRGGANPGAIAAVLVLDASDPLDVVRSLVRRSMVRSEGERFTLLTSIAEYAAGRLDLAAGAASEARHGRFHAAFGAEDGPGPSALRPELDNLIVASRRAAASGDGEVAASTALAAWRVLEMRGPVATGLDLLAAADGEGLPPALRARVLYARGAGSIVASRYAEAQGHLDRAGATAREIGHGALQANVLRQLGTLAMREGRTDDAEARYEGALAGARASGAREIEAGVLGNVATLRQDQGRMDEARALHEEALRLHRDTGDQRAEGVTLGNLATLAHNQGRLDEARAAYEAALEVHRAVGNRVIEGNVLGNLAYLHMEQGRMDEAGAHYEAALRIHREVGNRRYEGVALDNLGLLRLQQERPDEAEPAFEAALAIAREGGDRSLQGYALGHLGYLHRGQGRPAQAEVCYEQALTLHREIGSRWSEANLLTNLGTLYFFQGRMAEAEVRWEAASALHRALGNHRSEGVTLGSLGTLRADAGRFDEARTLFGAGAARLREVGAGSELAFLQVAHAAAEFAAGAPDTARALLSEAEGVVATLGPDLPPELVRELERVGPLLRT